MGVETVATYSQFHGNSMLNCRNWSICHDWSASPSVAVFGEMDSSHKTSTDYMFQHWVDHPNLGVLSKNEKPQKSNSGVSNHQKIIANGEAFWDPPFFGEVWGGYIFSAETLKPSSLPIFQPCILCGFCHFVLVHPALVELCKWDPADLVTWKNPPRKMARSNCKICTPRKLDKHTQK